MGSSVPGEHERGERPGGEVLGRAGWAHEEVSVHRVVGRGHAAARSARRWPITPCHTLGRGRRQHRQIAVVRARRRALRRPRHRRHRPSTMTQCPGSSARHLAKPGAPALVEVGVLLFEAVELAAVHPLLERRGVNVEEHGEMWPATVDGPAVDVAQFVDHRDRGRSPGRRAWSAHCDRSPHDAPRPALARRTCSMCWARSAAVSSASARCARPVVAVSCRISRMRRPMSVPPVSRVEHGAS